MATREQQRAQAAYNCVKGGDEAYGRVCAHLPALIHECGLCQTVAFLLAKGNGEEKKYFYDVLADLWSVVQPESGLDVEAIDKRVREEDSITEYQRLSHEALACAQWFSRYAEALMGVTKDQRQEGS